ANEALKNAENDNVVYMQHGGLKKVMLIQKMWQSDFKYVSCITEDVFMEKIVHMRRNYMYSLFICILIGGITICWAIKIHYMPIKRITKAMSQNFEYDSGLNEYQYLMSVVSKIASEYQTNSQYKELEKRLARNSFLLSVLKGEELLNDIFSRLGYFGVSFKNPCFCVVAINLEDCSKLFFEQEESEDNLGLAKLIIINVMEDMVKDKFELAFCENGDEIFMLISLLNSGQMQELQERLSETQKLIESLSNVHLFMSVSAAYEDFKNISVCYREAVELIRYCRIRNERFLTYSDNAQLNNGEMGQYIYSADVEQKLISYLTYGNYEKSSMLLQEILNNNFKNENAASIKVRCLVFDIIATVFKVIRQNENVSKTVDIEKTDLLIVIDDFESVAFVQEELLKVFKQICDNVKVNLLRPSEKLSDSIIEFVKTNYNNQNLNVAYISEKFNVSANYVSSVFKREKGIPLSEYISAVRIEHAGELLKTTNLKVAEIAEEVGFASLRTFSRVFNSVVGISPIEYRKNK
ncbi:MAG: helix-turn-helix domain-containing protein, partial [Clostridia bacterium]|nr:helix-turn-helix domain-containing protein [Clostridia bacterium]